MARLEDVVSQVLEHQKHQEFVEDNARAKVLRVFKIAGNQPLAREDVQNILKEAGAELSGNTIIQKISALIKDGELEYAGDEGRFGVTGKPKVIPTYRKTE